MTNHPCIPDLEIRKRLLKNLYKSRLALETTTLELEKITANLEHQTQQQRLARLKRSLDRVSD